MKKSKVIVVTKKVQNVGHGFNFKRAGPDLPIPLADHCLLQLGKKLIFVGGGRTGEESYSDKTFLFDSLSGKFHEWKRLPFGPRSNMLCLLASVGASNSLPVIVVSLVLGRCLHTVDSVV